MTIREAIKTYEEIKAKYLNRDYMDIVNNTSLCVIIPLKNGIEIFIDMHHEVNEIKKKYPQSLPNKNGVFKRICFDIIHHGIEPSIPDSLKKYTRLLGYTNGNSHCVCNAKERPINEFINLNGGIDEERYLKLLEDLWRACAEVNQND